VLPVVSDTFHERSLRVTQARDESPLR